MKKYSTLSGILFFVAMWISTSSRAQNAQVNSVDSLIAQTSKLMDVQLDSAALTATRALNLAKKLNLRNQQLLLLERLGMVELRKGNYDACKSFLDQIFEECKRSDCTPDVLGIAYNTLGAYYFRTGNALAAGDNFFQSAEYYKKSSTPERAQASLMNSATVLVNTGAKQKAFDTFKSVVQNPKSDTINIYKAYNNMAMIRASEQNFKEAISLFKQLLDVAGRAGIEDNSIYYNLALAYEEDGQYREALKLYQQITAPYELSGEKRMLLKVNQGMANTYAALKNNAKALEYLQKAEQNLDTTEQRMEYIDLLAMKHLLYANMGNYSDAYKYLVDYQREIMDSELKDSREKYMELQTK